jgi:hypothetical protein
MKHLFCMSLFLALAGIASAQTSNFIPQCTATFTISITDPQTAWACYIDEAKGEGRWFVYYDLQIQSWYVLYCPKDYVWTFPPIGEDDTMDGKMGGAKFYFHVDRVWRDPYSGQIIATVTFKGN